MLNRLYRRYNRREYVYPDPLVFLYEYGDLKDREIVGLIASSLAYGRVAQIMKSISSVLAPMGNSPFLFLVNSSPESLLSTYEGFRHRFTSGKDIFSLLWAAKAAIEQNGSLCACFCAELRDEHETVLPALSRFVHTLRLSPFSCRRGFLPSPEEGSACKRWSLFLRWMVRQDAVDPGGWTGVSPSKLVVPLDTHMHRIALNLGLTRRKQSDRKTVLEITRQFKRVAPMDPVRYDFVLTRTGIRKDMDWAEVRGPSQPVRGDNPNVVNS